MNKTLRSELRAVSSWATGQQALEAPHGKLFIIRAWVEVSMHKQKCQVTGMPQCTQVNQYMNPWVRPNKWVGSIRFVTVVRAQIAHESQSRKPNVSTSKAAEGESLSGSVSELVPAVLTAERFNVDTELTE